jgi:hypothetical protein
MNWYSAKIVFQIQIESVKIAHQFDESIRLIHANNKEEAFQLATKIGFENQSRFKNINGDWVMWSFIAVVSLYEIDKLQNGVEMYSMIIEDQNPDHYIQVIKNKAKMLEENPLENPVKFE